MVSGRQLGSIEVRPFDPVQATPADWANYHAYRSQRLQEDYPGEPLLPDAEFERALCEGDALNEARRLVALRDGDLVGNLILEFRRDGSPDCADFAPFVGVWGGVLARHRRQGIGTALMAALHSFMQARNKTTATMRTHLSEGRAFMAAIGAKQNWRSVNNRLSFDRLDWSELARWQANAIKPGDDLNWEIHAGRVPMERLAQLMTPSPSCSTSNRSTRWNARACAMSSSPTRAGTRTWTGAVASISSSSSVTAMR